MNNDIKEIGSVKELDAWRVHKDGKDWEIAQVIKELQEGHDMTQEEIGDLLDMPQYRVSKYKRLLNLIPGLFSALRAGEIARYTGYELSKLPEIRQEKYLERVKEAEKLKEKLENEDLDKEREKEIKKKLKEKRVTHKEVKENRKKQAITEELENALDSSTLSEEELEDYSDTEMEKVECPECGHIFEVKK